MTKPVKSTDKFFDNVFTLRIVGVIWLILIVVAAVLEIVTGVR